MRPAPVPQRRSPLAITAVVVGALVLAAIATANVWTEVVWFDQLGFSEVWRTQWIARILLFAAGAVIAGGAVWLNLWIAKRVRPARLGGRTQLDQLREQIAPLERFVMLLLPAVVGLVAGLALSSQWSMVLAFLNRQEFGEADPIFGLDASFYVFTLPVLDLVLTMILTLAVVCAVIAAFVHLLYGGIAGSGRSFIASRGARIQLAILGAIVMLAIAANYWLDRYGLLTSSGEKFYGASYTDVNAILPSRSILAGIAIVVALVFLVVIWRGDWRIPAVGIALMIVAAIAVGGIYPSIVQRFQVSPNEQELETPYIQNNIDATLYAYGLDGIETTPYRATTEATAGALRADAETTAQIRLLDPNVVSPAFQQLQQNKQYYNFSDLLAVDRYMIDGELQDTVIAVRELNLDGLSNENRNWVNDHTVFTHGFGVVAAYGNRTTSDGQPSFFEGGIPSSGLLGEYEPRVYFGTTLPDYSIVGAPDGTAPWELDYPDDDSANGQVNTTYTGDGGPGIGNIFAKLMYAIRLGEEQLLFSDRVTTESQILYYRDPLERVARVAPYLELDKTTYPAVVDGKIVWVVDGYTTTDQYPYSAPVTATTLFADAASSPLGTTLNYMRNSVKATVDAYDGSVTLYVWDEDDPIIETWANVFPASFEPMSEISGSLMSHLRYPEDMFTVQRYQLTRYHVTDAAAFYSGQDVWENPDDPTDSTRKQPPYYLTLQMPGQESSTFSLTSTFIPGGNSNRNILTGFLAVDSETGSSDGQVAEGYGTLRLLELPRDTTIPGPGQVQNTFNSDSEAQTTLNLLRQGETDVISGNLLTLPVGGGLLYVQPVYVQASTGTQVPLLRKVFVAFGDEVGFADTLPEALDQVFGDGAGDGAAGSETDGGTTDEGTTDEGTTDEGTTDPTTEAALRDALDRANQALVDGQAALADNDWAAYGEAQQRLQSALEDAIAAEAALSGEPEVSASAEPSASPSPTPEATSTEESTPTDESTTDAL
ncbi:UPF0182 family protein [Demequina sp. SYSU T00039]|uniref:UPF0182 protein QQX10_09025 n=1 Tax=Demequina lignilytica TaxID=3051663 RepID=A0AAW7M187_9MICO|nr:MULTISPECIES: UPF0182 family protein [unclassified Demequina]MDN4478242.1 UPF0182 family protein [Demequina sp. SYSU T00039-1]MDN4488308.1 UPF0182 family protein [Demequina sp. SYSU T00039]